MLKGVLILLGCQLAGEWVVVALDMPVPGPVLGMLLLVAGLLLLRCGVPEALRGVAENLLKHLALLFVPAGVGLMAHFDLLAREWLVLVVTLILSTAITMAFTGWVLSRLARRMAAEEEQ